MRLPFRKFVGAALVAALASLGAPQASAQPAPQPAAQAEPPVLPMPAPPLGADDGRLYVFGGLAGLVARKNDQLSGERGEAALIAGAGWKVLPYLSVEGGLFFASRHLDTPAATTPPAGTFQNDPDTSIGTGGGYLGVKGHFQAGPLEPYVGLGVGRYSSDWRTTTEAPGCQRACADTGPRITSTSRDTGYHLAVGADYRFLRRNAISVELRQLKLDARFDDIGVGKVHVGGTLLWVGFRRYFF
jgi:outer membrane protein with beta-barrel domain